VDRTSPNNKNSNSTARHPASSDMKEGRRAQKPAGGNVLTQRILFPSCIEITRGSSEKEERQKKKRRGVDDICKVLMAFIQRGLIPDDIGVMGPLCQLSEKTGGGGGEGAKKTVRGHSSLPTAQAKRVAPPFSPGQS